MRLLVSPKSLEEARFALNGGADIIDVKNPREGSLGANFPWAIRAVADLVNGTVPVSATIGDLQYKPGTASLAALGAAVSGADYIKAGLLGVKTVEEAEDMLEKIVKAVKDFDSQKKVVAAAYSDHKRVGSISPMLLADVAKRCGADVVMVDTAIKDGRSTFEFMSPDELRSFVGSGQDLGMEVALAGTIGFSDVPLLKELDPDIIGIRGAVCGGDRNTAVREDLVVKFKEAIAQ